MSVGHVFEAARWLGNGQPVDGWTGIHVVFGIVAHRIGLSLGETTAIGVINEAAEGWIRAKRPGAPLSGAESGRNIAVDMGANTAGWLLSDLVSRKN